MSALEKFYKENYSLFVKKIQARHMQPADAEDVVQEAFARALKYSASFDENRQPLGAWFNTILNNTFKNYRHANFTGDFSFTEEDHDEAVEQEDDWLSKDLIKKIKDDIAKMNNYKGDLSHADVIQLVLIKGFKYKEAAQILDTSMENVKKICYRFKQTMREKYA